MVVSESLSDENRRYSYIGKKPPLFMGYSAAAVNKSEENNTMTNTHLHTEMLKLAAAVESLLAVNADLRDTLDRQLKFAEELIAERNQIREECAQLHKAVQAIRGEWL